MAVKIDTALDVSAYTIPTDEPESDGTLEWSSTTIVVVEAVGGGRRGIGWTYAPEAAGGVVIELLAPVSPGWRSRPSTRRSGT